MTIPICSLNQNNDQPRGEGQDTKQHIKPTKKSQPRTRTRRLISARRRPGVKNTDDDDDDDEERAPRNGHIDSTSLSGHDSSISSLVDSEQDQDDDDDFDNDDDDDIKAAATANEDDDAKRKDHAENGTHDQVKVKKNRQKPTTESDDNGDTQSHVDFDDLEAGIPKPVYSVSQSSQNHSDHKPVADNSLVDDHQISDTAQIDTSSHPSALSAPTSSSNSNLNTRRSKQQQTSVALSSQPLNTAIIFNQASWVTGLSAALAATTTSSNNNATSNDDQPVQTPRYIPYIEFENYSAYGNLIFDLNSGLGRTARVDCKPDGLEKAPPEALEEQFVRIQPSLEQPSDVGQPSPSTSGKGSRKKSHLPADEKLDGDPNFQDGQQGDQTPRRGNKTVSLSEKNKKKKKKKKKEMSTRTSPDHHDEVPDEPSDQPLKIKIISPPPSPSQTRLPINNPSTSASSNLNSVNNRPPSSLAGGLNRPSSAFSYAAFSEGNRSGSASEAPSLEPWAVPRSGRFWGHDDRQTYSNRRGGKGGFVPNRGGSGSGARGTLRKRAGFRADWPSTPPSSRRSLASHGSNHRPETPAGQSDAGRSVGSGAGWITVPLKQKGSGTVFQNRHSHLNFHKQQPEQAENGEWRHDGWEEIQRETDRKPHSNHRGRGAFGLNHQARGGAKWRGGNPSAPNRRPTTNLAPVPSNRSSQAPSTSDNPSVGSKTNDGTTQSQIETSVPSSKEAQGANASPNPTTSNEVPQINAQDIPSKTVTGGESSQEDSKLVPIPTADAAIESNQASSQSNPAVPSDETSPISVNLPKTIKIGTIPVYPPVMLPSVVIEKNESTKSKAPPSPINQGGSSVPSTDQSASTPELSDTPQVFRSASTLDENPSPKPDTELTPVISTESSSGSITLGSVGGAEVLKEAMSTPEILLPSHTSHHDSMMPQSRVEHPMRILNTFGHSRTSSFNSHTFPPGSFGPHPDLMDHMPHYSQPSPHSLPPSHHQPHLGSSNTYHNPIPAPPQSSIHTPANLYQPPLPAIPPLHYFDPNNHNLSYSHPPSLGPPPTNHVYGGYMAPPPPPQLGPSRPHPPPLYHPLPPQTTAFEPTPPPLPPPVSVTGATTPGMTLPGHFAPPKFTKVRITNPASGGGNHMTDHHHNSQYHTPYHPHRMLTDPTRSSDPSQIKITETGISYYEHNGVTYFGDSIPIPPPTAATSMTTPGVMDDGLDSGGEKQRGGAGSGDRSGMMVNMGIHEGYVGQSGDEYRPEDPYRFFNHDHYQPNGFAGPGFDLGPPIDAPAPHHPISRGGYHPAGPNGPSAPSGQVVLSQVIRPLAIPFG